MQLSCADFTEYALIVAHNTAGIELDFNSVLSLFAYLSGGIPHRFHPTGAVGKQGGNLQRGGMHLYSERQCGHNQ